MLHIDVVENKWSAGEQRCVARASVINGQIDVEGDPHWRGLVQGALDRLGDATPESLLHELAAHFTSDYVHATEPHDTEQCLFAGGDSVPFAPTQTVPAASAQLA